MGGCEEGGEKEVGVIRRLVHRIHLRVPRRELVRLPDVAVAPPGVVSDFEDIFIPANAVQKKEMRLVSQLIPFLLSKVEKSRVKL